MDTTNQNKDLIGSIRKAYQDITASIEEDKKSIEEKKKRQEALKNAIYGLGGDMEDASEIFPSIPMEIKKFKIPTEYSINLTWSQKIMFLYNKYPDGAFVEDIVKDILSQEPGLTEKRVKSAATYYSSDLKTKGYLDYQAIGIKYKYIVKREMVE